MIGDGAVEFGVDRGDLQHIGQEADQLEAARRQLLRARPHLWIILEQHRIMLAQHARAGAGRRNDIVEALERLDHLARDRLGVGAVAGIIGGLAAADLRLRHLDLAARAFEQLDRREADGGAEKIHKAGDEKADAKGPGLGAHELVL